MYSTKKTETAPGAELGGAFFASISFLRKDKKTRIVNQAICMLQTRRLPIHLIKRNNMQKIRVNVCLTLIMLFSFSIGSIANAQVQNTKINELDSFDQVVEPIINVAAAADAAVALNPIPLGHADFHIASSSNMKIEVKNIALENHLISPGETLELDASTCGGYLNDDDKTASIDIDYCLTTISNIDASAILTTDNSSLGEQWDTEAESITIPADFHAGIVYSILVPETDVQIEVNESASSTFVPICFTCDSSKKKRATIKGAAADFISDEPINNGTAYLFKYQVSYTKEGLPILGAQAEARFVDEKELSTSGKFRFNLKIKDAKEYYIVKIVSEEMESMTRSLVEVSADSPVLLDFKLIPELPTEEERILIEEKSKEYLQEKEANKMQDMPSFDSIYPLKFEGDFVPKSLPIGSGASQSGSSCSYSVPSSVYVSNLINGYNGTGSTGGFTGYINFDDYVAGVVHGEIGVLSSDVEVKKAQAIAARTFSLNRHNYGWAVNTGQAYLDVQSTSSIAGSQSSTTQVMLYNGVPIDAKYAARCGGVRTQGADEGTWNPYSTCNTSGSALPYLVSVPCFGHNDCSQYSESPCCSAYNSVQGANVHIFGHGVGLCQRGILGLNNNPSNDYCNMLNQYYTGICIANIAPSSGSGGNNNNTSANATPLSCGQTYSGTSTAGSSLITYYGCNNWTETGREYWHSITPSSSGSLTATISNFSGDRDVFILENSNPNSCIGTVSSSSATATVIGGQNYFVVVDSDDGSNSAYSLVVNCPTGGGTGGSEDITVQNASLDMTSVAAGGTVQVTADHVYSGSQLDSNLPSFDMDYYLSTTCGITSSSVLIDGDVSSLGVDDPIHTETESLLIPAGTAPGTYYIVVVGDADNELAESNESNNIVCVTITITGSGGTGGSEDITVQNASLDMTSVAAGGTVQVTADHVYSGSQLDSNLPSFDMDYYLSTTCGITSSSVLIDGDVSSLGVDDPIHTETESLLIPAGTAPGTYYIVVVGDADNELAESNESNNIVCVTITITGSGGTGGSEDITVQNASLDMTSVAAGGTVQVTADHVYSGSQLDSNLPSFDMDYYLSTTCGITSSSVLIDGDVSSLGVDDPIHTETESLLIPAGTAPGTYYIVVVGDADNELAESNESNNIVCVTITITGSGGTGGSEDITVQNASLDMTSVAAGGTVQVTADHVYSGSQLDSNLPSFDMDYYLSTTCGITSSSVLIDGDVSSLGVDDPIHTETESLLIPAGTAPGTYYIVVVGDADNELAESNESNNIVCVTITITGSGGTGGSEDITVQNASLDMTSVAAGGTVQVTADHVYSGSQLDSNLPSFDMDYYLSTTCGITSSSVLIDGDVSSLGVDDPIHTETESLLIPAGTAPGTYYIVVVGDADNELAESNESNNIVCVTITITGSGGTGGSEDITVQNASLDMTSVAAGGTVQVTADHVYSGSQLDSNLPSFDMDYYLSTTCGITSSSVLIDGDVSSLGVDDPIHTETESLLIPAGTAPGTYYIVVVGDADNELAESNESNNIVCVTITITGSGGTGGSEDITVQNASLDMTSVAAGGTVQVTADHVYSGSQLDSNLPSFDMDYYLSTTCGITSSSVLIDGDVSSLGVDDPIHTETESLLIPAGTAPGTYYIVVVGDADNELAESNESNNIVCVTITITGSGGTGGSEDITVQNASLDMTSVAAGGTVQVTADHVYSGSQLDSNLPSFDMDYYLSTTCGITSSSVLIDGDVSSLGVDDPIHTETESLLIPAGTAPGTYYIVVVGDADNELAESNESNNIVCVTITITGSGGTGGSEDITVQNASLDMTSVAAGGTVQVTADHVYSGSQLDSNLPSFDMDYYLSTTCGITSSSVLIDGDVSSLGVDDPIHTETESLLIPAGTAPGTYYIVVVGDADNELAESNESNNIVCVTITITGSGGTGGSEDITVQNASLDMTSVAAGGTVQVTADHVYSGSQLDSNLPSFDMDYYLSTTCGITSSSVLIDGDVSSLGVDDPIHTETESLLIPAGTAPGTYYIVVVGDADNELAESNESNNIVCVTITITAPCSPVPLIITGNSTVCLGISSYSVTSSSSMTWNLSSGGSIISGTNSPQLIVDWNTPGAHQISLDYDDGCGSIVSIFLDVIVLDIPSEPDSIAGPANLCVGDVATYTVFGTTEAIEWVISNGTPIGPTNSNTVQVVWEASGTGVVAVSQTNMICGTSSGAVYMNVSVDESEIVTLGTFNDVFLSTPSFTLFGGQPSSGTYQGVGVMGNTFDPILAGIGTHEILYIAGNLSCGFDTASTYITVLDTISTGITDVSLGHLNIYPNPANDFVVISSDNLTEVSVAMYDMIGKQIGRYDVDLSATNLRIDLNMVASGAYTLQFSVGQEFLGIKRLVVR